MSGIKGIPGGELVYAAATFAVAIAPEFDLADSSFFSAVGDGLAIIAQQAAAQNASEKTCENAQPPQCDYIPERESGLP